MPLVKPFVSLVVKKKKLTTKDTKDVTKGLEGNFSEVLTYPTTRNLRFNNSLPEERYKARNCNKS